MTVLVWIAIVAALAIGSMIFITSRRSKGGGTMTAQDARSKGGIAEGQSGNIHGQSGHL